MLPKATSFPNEDEDERTAIENGAWEEEISTTVEQGEVADKLRALALGGDGRRPNTNITATNSSLGAEDPMSDDQRAAGAGLSPPGSARLMVTHGNDTGRSLEVVPGKSYTVGRGIDNDLVLTDITASRKHFDLRFEGGTWVLADRGSGNGTLINSRIEDAPFVLATGDTIEVGNTAFRFEASGSALPRGAAGAAGVGRPARAPTDESAPLSPPTPGVAVPPPVGMEPVVLRDAAGGAGGDAAGLPRDRQAARAGYDGVERSPASANPPLDAARSSGMRSAAIPAQGQMRPRSSSVRPSGAYPPDRSGPMTGAPGAPVASGAASSASGPLQPSGALASPPATAGSSSQSAARSPALLDPSHGPLPATLPGPGAPAGRSPRMPFGFASVAEANAQLVSGIRPLNVAPGIAPRDATSTALVQPISYGSAAPPAPPPPAYRLMPPLSRRVVLGAVALAVFATVATVAIIKSLSSDVPALDHTVATATSPPPSAPLPTSREPAAAPRARSAVVAPSPSPSRDGRDRAAGSAGVLAVSPHAGAERAGGSAMGATTSDVRGGGAAGRDPADAHPVPPPDSAAVTSRPVSGDRAPPGGPAASAPPPVTAAIRPSAPAPRPAAPPRAPAIERRPVKRIEPRSAPRKAAEPPAAVRADKRRRGMQEAKSEAAALYRSKNFGAAAQALTSSLSAFSGEDAKELKNLASIYTQLGKNYSIGMAPGTKAPDAYVALNRALEFDKDVGAAFVPEIKEKLASTASRAAASYTASKDYEQAFQAVRVAEQLRSTSPTNKAVRDTLTNVAEDLLRGARAEQSSNPEAARQKLRQILGIVEPRSATYAQAQKLLSAL